MRRDQGNRGPGEICSDKRWVKCTFAALLAMVAASCNLYYGSSVPSEEEFCADLKDHTNDIDFGSRPLELGPTVKADDPPPPISGGTLTLSADHSKAVAADPDRDQVYIVDLTSKTLSATIPLSPKDEPGRVVIDASGSRAYVALRSGGAVAVIDLATKTLAARYALCPAPRGVAIDDAGGVLWVACNGGELVRASAQSGEVLAQSQLDEGLRDVILDATHVYVSIFRTAELLVLDREGQLEERLSPPLLETQSFDPITGEEIVVRFVPGVAWRIIPNPAGGVFMLHQRARKGDVSIQRGGYGGFGCDGSIVHAAITPLEAGHTPPVNAIIGDAVLPADLSLIESNQNAVVVSSGNHAGDVMFGPTVSRVPVNEVHEPFGCRGGDFFPILSPGQPIAVATFPADMFADQVVVQMREPAQLQIFDNTFSAEPFTISLSPVSRADTGHLLFHMNSGSNIACASCHPEGADDGKVWQFKCVGPRRTQSLQFGLLGTEPFHWDGDMRDFGTLMSEVFVGRMGGGDPSPGQLDAMSSWLDKVKAPPRSIPANTSAVDRGRTLFHSAAAACGTCHVGAKFTDNKTYDVGTGGKFQVPSLIGIANRAPYIHDGCAATLAERFTKPDCAGGDKHGTTSKLTEAEIADLVAYLKTL